MLCCKRQATSEADTTNVRHVGNSVSANAIRTNVHNVLMPLEAG